MMRRLFMLAVRLLLSLRYRVRVEGLSKAVAAAGRRGVLVLANHPALIDPIILLSHLWDRFGVRALGDRGQIDRFLIRRVAPWLGVVPIPDLSAEGSGEAAKAVREALETCVAALRAGDNLLLYPAGHIYRSRLEDLGGASAVERILSAVPDAPVVLVRTRGLWGSAFSWAGGREPDVARILRRGLWMLLTHAVLLAPRRRVTVELHVPTDLPRRAGRAELNRVLETFYNTGAEPNTFVPYSIWDRSGVRTLPEPPRQTLAGDPAQTPEATRQLVTEHLADLTGVEDFDDDARLAHDLGMDSLAGAELASWLQSEFAFGLDRAGALRTVGDVMLAACGQWVAGEAQPVTPAPRRWLAGPPRPECPANLADMTICQAFLAQAARSPDAAICADQASGVKTYRDLVRAILALKGPVEALPGERLGVMMPASGAAGVLVLTALFAGKTAVMVNWTLGPRHLGGALASVGVERVLTSRAVVERLAARGFDLGSVAERLLFVEDLAAGLGLGAKVSAAVRARCSWSVLRAARPPEVAAILFTSGSESAPKAVPLTHRNILTNVADACACIDFGASDVLMGILPPFHAFGLTASMVLPLCAGVRAVYHGDPTDAAALARLIEAYRATILIGTPTFLHGIVRAAGDADLTSLRVVVSGAEKCSQRVYDAVARRCPQTTIMEGYGVTECSPVISVNRQSDARRGTIGPLLGSLEGILLDPDTGRPARPGADGILCVRGPSVFGGYLAYDGPSPFVEAAGKTWYRTGDLVGRGPDGHMVFRGRLKRFAKLGGEMISLPAIEAALEPHLASDADEGPALAVVAAGDDDQAELVLFTTADVARADVNAHIRTAELSALHNIRRVVRLGELPVLGTGKTDYRALAERLRQT